MTRILTLYTSFEITPEQTVILLRMIGKDVEADYIYHTNQ
jgi:hypothetical protein